MAQTFALSRRALVLSASVWGALTVVGPAAAQAGPLSAQQAAVLDIVAEAIIPRTDTPGARDAGVPAFVTRALTNWCEPAQAQATRAGLDAIDAEARRRFGNGLAALTPDQQMEIVRLADRSTLEGAPPFFSVLKELVTTGYFTSEPGATKALRYELTPGPYRGCVPLAEIGRGWAL